MTIIDGAASRRLGLRYGLVAGGIFLWAAAITVVAAVVFPVDHYFISYYVVDYTFGFVRRGLAGEIVGSVADPGFFTWAITMRWVTTALYVTALAAVAFAVLRKGFTERRIMLALLIPVLPFGIPYAVYSARPDLLGAAAVIGLSLALSVARSPRAAILFSAAYGLLIGLLTLVHEGIVFEVALGSTLAVLVLAQGLTPAHQRWCGFLAVGPGSVAVLAVLLMSRRDISERFCALVPHEIMTNPLQGAATPGEVFDNLASNQRIGTDYHDWVCGWYLGTYDYSVGDGIREVLDVGVLGLVLSFLLGLAVIALTILALQYFSGVRFSGFVDRIRGNGIWVVAALLMMVPVFLTGLDWTRWLLVVAFNIAVVYLLFLRGRPELDETPSPRMARLFLVVVLAFAVIPVGLVPGGPVS